MTAAILAATQQTTTHLEFKDVFPFTTRPFAVHFNSDDGANHQRWVVNNEDGEPVHEFADLVEALMKAKQLSEERRWDEEAARQEQIRAQLTGAIQTTAANTATNNYPFDGMTDAEIESIPHDEFADKLFAYYDAQGPMLTCDQMDEIEQRWEEERRARRCALVILTKPFSELADMAREDRGFALAITEVLRATKDNQFYSGVSELLECANQRAQIMLCGRDDMELVLAEAEEVQHA